MSFPSTNNNSQTSSSFWQEYHFFILLLAAIVIKQLPLVSIPFNWLESYFHEISHGIAALLTGGHVLRIQLFANGAGLCTTQGGISFIISFAGYAGATLWGWGIYKLSSSHQRAAQAFSVLILVLLLCSIVFWGRDLLTWFILAVLAVIFLLTIKLQKVHYLQRLMQLFGLLILLNSLSSPSYLLDGRHLGDGAALASMTFIPEIIWIIIWFVLALWALYSLYKTARKS
ncbi:MAG: M50 family metallopeptidase [Colwellia sp.]|nr:M50 family metallopeptidase [Colwellia sp.]MCW8865562.1 M50 family metallopeptidase [Colwellia sp.]MCW9080195.1 M50 family metallopeptidase [Colwellia sp.]